MRVCVCVWRKRGCLGLPLLVGLLSLLSLHRVSLLLFPYFQSMCCICIQDFCVNVNERKLGDACAAILISSLWKWSKIAAPALVLSKIIIFFCLSSWIENFCSGHKPEKLEENFGLVNNFASNVKTISRRIPLDLYSFLNGPIPKNSMR